MIYSLFQCYPDKIGVRLLTWHIVYRNECTKNTHKIVIHIPVTMQVLFNFILFKFKLGYKKKCCFQLPFHQHIKKTESLGKGCTFQCSLDIFQYIYMLATVTMFQKHTAIISTHCPNTILPHKITNETWDRLYLFNNVGPTNVFTWNLIYRRKNSEKQVFYKWGHWDTEK